MPSTDADSRPVTVPRSPLFLAIAAVVLLIGIGMLFVNALAAGDAWSNPDVVAADIPINDDAAAPVIDGWVGVQAEAAGTSTIAAVVENVPSDLGATFLVAGLLRAATYAIVAVLGVFTAVTLFLGRLRWRMLPLICLLAGIVMSVGEAASQVLQRSAVLDLSSFVQSAADHWIEPGFGFGFDLAPILTGVVIASASILFLTASRFARDADGVV